MSILGMAQGVARGNGRKAPTWDELSPGAKIILESMGRSTAPEEAIGKAIVMELMHAGFMVEKDGTLSLTEGGLQMGTNHKLGE